MVLYHEMIIPDVTLHILVVSFCYVLKKLFCYLFFKVSIPAWFAMDTRLGSLSIHLDTPQCFSAEMYAVDLNISGAPEDLKVNHSSSVLLTFLKILTWLLRSKQFIITFG